MECRKAKNLTTCNCTFSCSHKGICCECVQYHRGLGELPACYFDAKTERTGDRSVEAYFRSLGRK